jgi:hypothetical protein
MKTLKLRLALLFVGTALTLVLSNVAAHAACADRDVGGTVYGNYDCALAASCGGSCYYECTCSNLFPGYTCDDVLDEAGFEKVDSIPCSG